METKESEILKVEVKALQSKVDILLSLVQKLTEDNENKLMDLKDVAKYVGRSVPTLYRNRWLLPDFGAGIEGNQKKEWTKKEIDNWLKTPVKELKNQYLERGMKVAQKYL